ncbi:putative dynactin p25 [Neospora caninum Liverpool]|uniref:Dynactin subunit 5 n=1 Tax=Neospora caninum (strain Liverpool) TaxID=572307 RepID=F0VNI7_NEOCL|nr:putative dynactin p25 [Neospora caninum Liverpool]CBZ55283.1 putative dynactin p25 [Neospora caninum Liverpool]CEL70014.1 TPA: dynactin p25, putative [Neospora caninum Liverpool]|eukprot:XP_003885311.1 putative dynactin p25 [Neospora caninum Liverpool]
MADPPSSNPDAPPHSSVSGEAQEGLATSQEKKGNSPGEKKEEEGDSPGEKKEEQRDSPVEKKEEQRDSPGEKKEEEGDSPGEKKEEGGDSPGEKKEDEGDSPVEKKEEQRDSPGEKKEEGGDSPGEKKEDEGDSPVEKKEDEGDSPVEKKEEQRDSPGEKKEEQRDSPGEKKEEQRGSPVEKKEEEGDSPGEKKEEQRDSPVEKKEEQRDSPVEKKEEQRDSPVEKKEEQRDSPGEKKEEQRGSPVEKKEEQRDSPVEKKEEQRDSPVEKKEEQRDSPGEKKEEPKGSPQDDSGGKQSLTQAFSSMARTPSLRSEASASPGAGTEMVKRTKRQGSCGTGSSSASNTSQEYVTFASHVPFRSYVSTGGVALELSDDSPGSARKNENQSVPSEKQRHEPRAAVESVKPGGSPEELADSQVVPVSAFVLASSSKDDFSHLPPGVEVIPPPSQPYTPFSCFVTPSLEPPVHYPRADYITTASGNRVGRGTLLFGSQNITLAGRSVVSQGVLLRGDMVSLRFGRYVYLDDNVLVHPSSYRSKGQTLHVPLTVGDYVIVGKNAVLRAVAVGSCVQIGSDCVVGNRCILKDFCKILPGTVLAADTVVPSFTVFGGKPGRMVAELPEGEAMLMKLEAIRKYNLFLPEEE